MLTQSPEKYQTILQTARHLFEQGPDWVTFFREVLGVDGVVRREFTRPEDLATFEKSPEYEQIQKWLVKLREQKNAADTETEPTRVITVRLPKSMHEYLRTEAHDLRTSMNKLCISKLLQVIEQDKIPAERGSGPVRKSMSPLQPQHSTMGTNSIGNQPMGASQPMGGTPQQMGSQPTSNPPMGQMPFRNASGF